MIRNALLLCAGILVATALACAPAVAPPPPPITVATVDCSSPGNFANSVQRLGANFVPDPLAPPGNVPPSNGPIVNPRITTDLANAFALAPPSFLRELCGTSGNPAVSLFVQDCPAAPGICTVGSWGYRQRATGARFIALSAGLWQGGAAALPYPGFETAVIDNLVGVPGLASYVSASNDSPEMTVLAVLAHELGHILFWNRSAINHPCPPPPARGRSDFLADRLEPRGRPAAVSQFRGAEPGRPAHPRSEQGRCQSQFRQPGRSTRTAAADL
jgi:hypothetical protein